MVIILCFYWLWGGGGTLFHVYIVLNLFGITFPITLRTLAICKIKLRAWNQFQSKEKPIKLKIKCEIIWDICRNTSSFKENCNLKLMSRITLLYFDISYILFSILEGSWSWYSFCEKASSVKIGSSKNVLFLFLAIRECVLVLIPSCVGFTKIVKT